MKALANLKRDHNLRLLLVTILYVAAAQASLSLAFHPIGDSLMMAPEGSTSLSSWLPIGIGIALMMLLGHRIWPAITMGSMISAMLVLNNRGQMFSTDSIITISIMSLISTVECLGVYFAAKQLINQINPFKKARHIFVLTAILIVVFTIGGMLVMFRLSTTGVFELESLKMLVTHYVARSVCSVFILAPLILSWSEKIEFNVNRNALIEGLIFTLAVTGVVFLFWSGPMSSTLQRAFPMILMPLLLWMSFRTGLQALALVIFGLSIGVTALTATGYGPFVVPEMVNAIILVQLFIGTSSFIGLVVNAVVFERLQAEKATRAFNERLEQSVQERTKALNEEISMRKATEEKIKISNKKLRKANVELDNFVYSVSHDLRAPVASVIGLANLAMKEKDKKMMTKYFQMIAKSAQQQDAFIRDILDLSRNARLDVAHEVINLKEIIDGIFDQFQFIDSNLEIEKTVTIKQELPFHSDQSRVKVILNNLISNSIRHCEQQQVSITIHVDIDEETASLKLSDNGKGIGPEHLSKIFKMFYRGTESTAGSGLGLYIVKETIDKLRGAISIDSEIDEGTHVSIEIPNLYEHKTSTSVS